MRIAVLSDVHANSIALDAVLAESEWTRELLIGSGGYDWVASLPLEARVTLPDGTRVRLVHAAPGTDEGSGIHAGLSDDELLTLLDGVEADLVIVGHTHRSFDRVADGVRVINLGSVSNPPGDDKRATWVEIDATEEGYRVERNWAAYDLAAVRHEMKTRQVPSWSYVRRYFEPGN